MSNPVLIEITRGGQVESRHRGAYAVTTPDGDVVASAGAIDAPVFPRSSVKALQALPLVESGWADRLGLDDADLALACASHGGEPVHVDTAHGMLTKAGQGVEALECGVHWPTHKGAARSLAEAGARPTALHNNCSGKHAGFLCLACALDADPRGYVDADHPVQRAVKGALTEVYDHPLDAPGIDGCSIPTYAVPLRQLSTAFARLGSGDGFGPVRAAAAARLRRAVAAHPVLVGGDGFLDTRLSARFGERLLTKTGAEGVFCAAIPERGLGVALKCDDGATRGSEAILVALVARLMAWDEADRTAFADVLDPELRNWNGVAVGEVRATGLVTAPADAAP